MENLPQFMLPSLSRSFYSLNLHSFVWLYDRLSPNHFDSQVFLGSLFIYSTQDCDSPTAGTQVLKVGGGIKNKY